MCPIHHEFLSLATLVGKRGVSLHKFGGWYAEINCNIHAPIGGVLRGWILQSLSASMTDDGKFGFVAEVDCK